MTDMIMTRLAVCLLTLSATNVVFAVDVIAHRGYGCHADENSITSIHRAWRANADAIELDVRVSRDGIAYLFHDDEIGAQNVDVLTLAQVRALSDQQIATLASAIERSPATAVFVFDLKTTDTTDLPVVFNAIDQTGLKQTSFSVQSESLEVLNAVRAHYPEVKLAYLSKLRWRVPYLVRPSAVKLAQELNETSVDRVSIKGRSFINAAFVDLLKTNGREVHVWTINDPARALHYRNLGVDGIITDNVAGVATAMGRQSALHLDCDDQS